MTEGMKLRTGVLTGTNEMLLNEATIIKAVQYYFDEVLFSAEVTAEITSVRFDSSQNQFVVRIEEPQGKSA
jgi:hypothetical protein